LNKWIWHYLFPTEEKPEEGEEGFFSFGLSHVLLVWGYGWRGTYAGSLFLEDPSNWEAYRNAHLLLLRWKDTNRDGFVQLEEVTVEQCA